MSDFLFNQMMGKLASHIKEKKIKAILVTPAEGEGVEINYIMPEDTEPLCVGEVIVLKHAEYEALKSLANEAKFM